MNSIIQKWKNGLVKTSKSTISQIATILGTTEINQDTFEDLEAVLVQADLGLETSQEIIRGMQKKVSQEGIIKASELKIALKDELRQRISKPPEINFDAKPAVILIVGVNGSGKTTTIAKLGRYFLDQGKKVMLGAADTFRAAAVDQLQVWAGRLDIPIITGQMGGDSGAVAFDAVQSAQAHSADLVIIDTAGRLHTRYNLMEELKKIHRVVGKAQADAPHAVWLVMDATTGQNALPQARAFQDAVNVTGIILAKLDSSARGGMVFAIQRELNIPILFAGLGEKMDDLQPFDPDLFVNGILSEI